MFPLSETVKHILAQSDICVTVKKKNINLPNLFSEGKRAVVGYEDGTVRVWDLKQGNAVHVIKGGNGGARKHSSCHV